MAARGLAGGAWLCTEKLDKGTTQVGRDEAGPTRDFLLLHREVRDLRLKTFLVAGVFRWLFSDCRGRR